VVPTSTTTYTVSVSNGMCSSTGSIAVQVNDPILSTLFVPNVFTPNGDNLNEIFKTGSTNLVEFKGEIFNRWGDLIFTWYDDSKGWDGRYNGKEAPEGVYVYIIHAKNECNTEETKTGAVTLLR